MSGLGDMGQDDANQVNDVLIGEPIGHVLAAPLTSDEMDAVEQPQALGDCRQLLSFGLCQLAHAGATPFKVRQQTKPGGIGDGAQKGGPTLQNGGIDRERGKRSVPLFGVLATVRNRFAAGHRRIISSIVQLCK
jgi:hypothetical protein